MLFFFETFSTGERQGGDCSSFVAIAGNFVAISKGIVAVASVFMAIAEVLTLSAIDWEYS